MRAPRVPRRWRDAGCAIEYRAGYAAPEGADCPVKPEADFGDPTEYDWTRADAWWSGRNARWGREDVA